MNGSDFTTKRVVGLAAVSGVVILSMLGFGLQSADAEASSSSAVGSATVHGVLASATGGTAIPGASVTVSSQSGVDHAVTGADGSFSVTGVAPGTDTVQFVAAGFFTGSRTITVSPDQDQPVLLAAKPAGTVTADLSSKTGHPFLRTDTSIVVDGCRVQGEVFRSCNVQGSLSARGATNLMLVPGEHTIRYQITSPVTGTERHTTERVTVTAATTVDLGTMRFKADPTSQPTITSRHFRTGHALPVAVKLPTYTDGTTPMLPADLLVNGKKVTGMPHHVTGNKAGEKHLKITVLPSHTHKAVVRVQVVFHGTKAYSGSSSKTVTMPRR